MNQDASEKWRRQLDAVLHAASLGAAQAAASDLIDDVLPGGAATVIGAADLVRLVRVRTEVHANPYRSYVLGVLLSMATWTTVWRRAVAGGNTSKGAAAQADAEVETELELAAACRDLAMLASDEDPETRSLSYLLLGAAALPAFDVIDALESLINEEKHPLAHACGVQALTKTIARLRSADRVHAAARVANQISKGNMQDRARVQRELDSVAYTPAERKELGDLIDLEPGSNVSDPLLWPAESV